MNVIFRMPMYSRYKDKIKDTWDILSWQGGTQDAGEWSNENVRILGEWSHNPTLIHYYGPEDHQILKNLIEVADEIGAEWSEETDEPEDLVGDIETAMWYTPFPGRGKPRNEVQKRGVLKLYILDLISSGKEVVKKSGGDVDDFDFEKIAKDILKEMKSRGISIFPE